MSEIRAVGLGSIAGGVVGCGALVGVTGEVQPTTLIAAHRKNQDMRRTVS